MQQLSNRAESHLSSQVEMENLGKGAWVNYGYNTSPPPLQRNISTLYNPQPAYHSPMDNMAKLNMPNPYPAEVKEERLQEEKKSSGCCSCIKGIWGTTLTEDTKGNREQFVKTTLRELVVYIVFLVDICILTYGMTSPNTYYYTKVMTKLFVNTASGSAVSFANIGSMDDFWAYAQGPLIDGLYWTKWYNNRPLQPQIPSHLYYENILLGVPRVRQLRVMNNTCKVATEFSGQINSCFDSYSDVKEDNKDIGVINGTAWRYHSESAMNGSSYWGVLTTYGGGGYYQDLANNRTGSAALLADLYSNMWLNHGTRAVFVDFSTYNANINLFCVIRLVVEFLPSGGAVTSYQIRTVKLIRYITTWDYVVLGFEVLFCVFILYYIVEEILEIRIHKLSYFKSIWNILDVVIIMLAIVAIIFNVFRTVKVDNLLEQTLRDPNIYADFEFLAFWQTQYNNMNAVNLFFAWIKIFKYISFNKTMTQLSSTLARCAADIFGFAIMFFIVFFAYAQLGYLIFGSQVETFSIFHKCIFTQFRIILGDFDYDSIDQANRVLGPIYFFTYVFFVFFVLMNMFLAIINDTYCEVKEELASQKDDLQITDIFKQSFMNLKRKKEKISDVQKALQSGSSALEFRDFREKLKEMGHADQEITAAFAKYDRDGNQILDQVEQERMKRELEEKRDALCKELNSLGRNYGTKDNEQNQGSSRVTQEEFQTLARQVRQLEYSVATIMSNMDSVMEKLDLPPKANNKEATGRLVAAKKDEERPASGGNVMVNLRRGAGEELPFSSPNAVGNSRPLANAGPNRLYPDVGWPKVNQHSPSNRH